MIEIINYKDTDYPKFQTLGNASQFAIPFAKHAVSYTHLTLPTKA